MANGKRGLALGLSFMLHVISLLALLLGVLSPYWAKISDANDNVIGRIGLVMDYSDTNGYVLLDFNIFKNCK